MSNKVSKKDVADYLAVFPELVLEILEEPDIQDTTIVKQWAAKVLYYNVPNKEMLHGLATVVALKHLNPNPTSSQLKDAYIIGWCLQMFASCYFILDDIFDDSTQRHYKPTWHLIVNNKLSALNDITLIESCVFYLIKKHFGSTEFYPQMLNILHDLSFKMAMSQNMELRLSNEAKSNSNKSLFAWEQYKTLVNYKMCYYPTAIHVLFALYLAGINSTEIHSKAKEICKKIDFHFQPRDDFLDVYGDNQSHEAETGNDIEEGRCTWNIVTALEILDEDDSRREQLMMNYGKKTGVQLVINIFNELEIPKIFEEYELKQYNEILEILENLPQELPKELFIDMMWASFPKRNLKADNMTENADSSTKKLLTNDVPDFLGIFPELIYDLILDPCYKDELCDLESWIGRLFHYNVPHGKKTRGLTIPLAYRMLGNGKVSTEEMKKCYILGWCLEMLQSAALIADDVMDSSSTRRGRLCWYKLNEVGLEALNDATILESAIYRVLRKHFGDTVYYIEILELFQDVTYKTAHGQALDVLTGMTTDITMFTKERYSLIVKYKTSYYTFILPIALSLAMLGLKTKSLLQDEFLLDIGHFFQVQDDYLDCFGKTEETGKIGTDIADGKCSWLIVEALERATPEQQKILTANYGKGVENIEKVELVKKLYEDMQLPEIYAKYEAETYERLKNQLEVKDLISDGHKNILIKILETTQNRKA